MKWDQIYLRQKCCITIQKSICIAWNKAGHDKATAGVHISESNQKSYLFCYLSLFLCLCDKNSSIHNFCWRFLCKFFPLSHKKILISWRKIVFYKLGFQSALSTLHKKWSFPIKISSVNVTKSARNCGFSHIYWRNL